MKLESPKVTIEKNPEDIFNFLSDVKNFEKLMPENISKFELLDSDKFVFALKGMPEIVLKQKEASSPNKLVLGAAGGKLDFSLTANIEDLGNSQSTVGLQFEGDFNPMMAMMIKGPIGKFIETLTTNLKAVI
ncbi:MAG: orotate phosphoribosyltransferase [Bacteroidetes bacterium MedPE-SWsnd-G2]|nr:MAG: orotate phosphoribosyltransferase [Bacteroidetes bacterium MedPE-SWsnd-G2]